MTEKYLGCQRGSGVDDDAEKITPEARCPQQASTAQPGTTSMATDLDTTQSDPPKPEQPAYSSFTVTEKRCIIAAGSFAAFFSPLTGSIYFPALTTISNDLCVSASKINLTVTTYLIWQGVAPMLIAGFSDNVGRRPAYIICFSIYVSRLTKPV